MSDMYFKDFLRKKGVYTLYHLTHLNNVVSILNTGIYSKNEINCKNINYKNISNEEVQKKGKINMKGKFGKDIEDFVRLFFTAHTPMLRNICFLKHEDHEICLLQINPDIMDKVEKLYYSDLSCSRRLFNLHSTINNMKSLKWKYLIQDYDYLREKESKYTLDGYRGAEVLIYKVVPSSYIKSEILVKSKRAMNTLKEIIKNQHLQKKINIIIDPYKFPLRDTSLNYKLKNRVMERALTLKEFSLTEIYNRAKLPGSKKAEIQTILDHFTQTQLLTFDKSLEMWKLRIIYE